MKIDRKGIAIVTTGIALTVSGVYGSLQTAKADAPIDPPHRAIWMKTPCPQEDWLGCAWNAKEQGNSHGHSFYAPPRTVLRGIDGKRLGVVACHFMAGERAADRWDNCQILHRRHR